MNTLNPIEHFLNWYFKQPDDVRSGIAEFVLVMHPDSDTVFKDVDIIADSNSVLVEWLRAEVSLYQRAGRIFHVKSAMDFIVIRHFGNKDEWDAKREKNQWMIKRMRETGRSEMADKLERTLDKFPDRERIWLDAANSWAELNKSFLSTEVIETWFDGEEIKGIYGSSCDD